MVRTLLLLFSIIVFSFFAGHFTSAKAQQTGTLSVSTMPVSGTIFVDFVFKGTKFWSGNLDVGSHEVSFGDVDGYITPPPQIVTIIADQTYYVIGAYRTLLSLLKSECPACGGEHPRKRSCVGCKLTEDLYNERIKSYYLDLIF
jgi:ribosomal protein S27AE